MVLLADSEGPDQTVRMCRLIWAFDIRISPKTYFRIARLSYNNCAEQVSSRHIRAAKDQISLVVRDVDGRLQSHGVL